MRFLLCLLFAMFYSAVNAQPITPKFPDAYFGVYKGDLNIKSPQSEQTIAMEFHLQPTDSIGNYEYRIVYIVEGNRQERHYNLLAVDAENGEYVVDENNGIVIPAKQFENRLYSIFEVQGNLLTTTLVFNETTMLFEIVFSNKANKQVSGNQGEAIPEVISYPVIVSQRAMLKKQ